MRAVRTAVVGRSRLRRFGGSLCAASLVLAAVACGDDDSSGLASAPNRAAGSSATGGATASDGSTIKIGYLGPQSGAVGADLRRRRSRASQAYVKYWNDRGGVNGHQLELSVYDTQSNSSAVLAGARKAVGDGVQAIISQRCLLRHGGAVPRRAEDPGVRLRHHARLLRSGQADVLLADGQLDRLPEQRRHEVPRRPGAQARSPSCRTRTRATPTPPTPSPTRCRPWVVSWSTRTTASTRRTPPRCWRSPSGRRRRAPRPSTPTSTARRRRSCRPTSTRSTPTPSCSTARSGSRRTSRSSSGRPSRV